MTNKIYPKILMLVEDCENQYGSIMDTPYFCKQLKTTRKLCPSKGQRTTTHHYIKKIKQDYENNYTMEGIRARYHVRKDNIKFFADIYHWHRPKGKLKRYKGSFY